MIIVTRAACILVLLCTFAVAAQDERSVTASVMISVTGAPGPLPIDVETVQELIGSTDLLLAAAREFGPLPAAWRTATEVEVRELRRADDSSNDGDEIAAALYRISVTVSDGAGPLASPDNVHKFARRLCAELQAVYDRTAENWKQMLLEYRDAAAYDGGHLRSQLESLRASSQQLTKSRAEIVRELRIAEDRARELSIELVGLTARQQALAEQIARVQQEVQSRTDADPVAKELARVVEIREKELGRIVQLHREGTAPASEVDRFEERLALARADLGRQHQTVPAMTGGELLTEFNRDLLKLTVEIAALEAQRQAYTEILTNAQTGELLTQAAQQEQISADLPFAEEAAARAHRRYEEAERRLRARTPVRVNIISSPESATQ